MFWWIAFGLLGLVIVRSVDRPPEICLGALLIIFAALLPNYLWVSRKVGGLPIFPLYALTAIWIYALPLVLDHPIVVLFPASAQFVAALSITGFLLLGTGTWYVVVRRPTRPIAVCWMFDARQKEPALILALGVTTLVTLAFSAGWLPQNTRLYSTVRAVLLAAEALICFVLSYQLGQKRLSAPLCLTFYLLLGVTLLVNLTGLLLINVMSLLGLSLVAYTVGSRKLPWRVCLVALVVLSFLHLGKATMREKYWQEEDSGPLSPSSYPSFLAEWTTASWSVIENGDNSAEAQESLAQRASLMHLLLYMQGMTPAVLPFLYGESYLAVPVQLVPRIFYPDKPRSHEGTYILSVYYNIQTREDTETTTIDIGLINEAYANFGFAGMAVLGVVLGGFYGATEKWARRAPIFSFRSLFAILILASILEGSSSASYYVASIYQSTIVLIVLSLILMRPMQPGRLRNQTVD